MLFQSQTHSWINALWNESMPNGYILLLSHVQWTLSLVVDVRRNDSILSWNDQDFSSNSAYTISFVWNSCFVVYSKGFTKTNGQVGWHGCMSVCNWYKDCIVGVVMIEGFEFDTQKEIMFFDGVVENWE